MIYDNNPITNNFISVPPDLGQLDCGAFMAGILAGVLEGARFPAKVTAHSVSSDDNQTKTVFLMKFSNEVCC